MNSFPLRTNQSKPGNELYLCYSQEMFSQMGLISQNMTFMNELLRSSHNIITITVNKCKYEFVIFFHLKINCNSYSSVVTQFKWIADLLSKVNWKKTHEHCAELVYYMLGKFLFALPRHKNTQRHLVMSYKSCNLRHNETEVQIVSIHKISHQ